MQNESNNPELPLTFRFNYAKSKDFRVVRCDGVWGGITPRGEILMSLFNERLALPNYSEHEVHDDGSLGRLLEQKTDTEGIIREVEVMVAIRPDTAVALAQWLTEKVEQLKQAGVIGQSVLNVDIGEEPS